MNAMQPSLGTLRFFAVAVVVALGAIGIADRAHGQARDVSLTGNEEVPKVSTPAAGTAMIVVRADKSVSGSVTTTGISGTMAHIHEGAIGKNGPVVVPLVKAGETGWAVAPGAKLSDGQYDSYKAGNLYVNVHSAAHPDGEIRAQLKPN